jgi:hypothetical protein
MFPYDPALLAAVQAVPQTVADVLQIMRTMDGILPDNDGLKWFQKLYLQVTDAVEQRVATAGGFSDPAWLAALDVQFAKLYFGALAASLGGGNPPGCWQALFARRGDVRIARIQFALAGMNAHINHDLPEAIVNTCSATGSTPARGGVHYKDYTALDATLAGLVDTARQEMHVRLLGDALPPVTHLEDTLAAFGVDASRDVAWTSGEILWSLRNLPPLSAGYMRSLDVTATFAAKALLSPVPM